MRCVTREPIATTSLPRELMTQKRWVDVEDFATDSEREAIDGDEPEPEIGWRASLDVWPQLCSRTLVVQVIGSCRPLSSGIWDVNLHKQLNTAGVVAY